MVYKEFLMTCIKKTCWRTFFLLYTKDTKIHVETGVSEQGARVPASQYTYLQYPRWEHGSVLPATAQADIWPRYRSGQWAQMLFSRGSLVWKDKEDHACTVLPWWADFSYGGHRVLWWETQQLWCRLKVSLWVTEPSFLHFVLDATTIRKQCRQHNGWE